MRQGYLKIFSAILALLLLAGCYCSYQGKSRVVIEVNGQVSRFSLEGYRWREVFEVIAEESGLTIDASAVPNDPAGDLDYRGVPSYPELLKAIDEGHPQFRIIETMPGNYLVQPADDQMQII